VIIANILRLQLWSVVATVALGLTGCNDTVIDPFENSGHYFTVYGYLDFRETNHSIRVIPVTRRAEKISGAADVHATIDAEVVTTDLNSGERVRWNHTLSQLEDGTFGHVFIATFMVHQAHTYRLEVIRSDGITASAETKVPSIGKPNLFELGPEVFSADSTELFQNIHIPEISSPWQMEVAYLGGRAGTNQRENVAYHRAGGRAPDGGWNVTIRISDDQEAVRENVQEIFRLSGFEPNTPVGIHSMGIRVHMLDDNWDPPGGIFDPEKLAVPGTLSNVKNGYGFFGSVGVYQQLWNIEHLSVALGYDF